ncbi:MAG: hypothetical protein ACX93U_02960 [Salipiger thiooxidans]|uniref:hypothetical protein n=1 Tax=Salipiger thiooxidans TaxID=282683 RepID=UPI001CF9E2D1|nr:hypothetical protein [Salipiger thiooxidans]
MSLVLLGLCRPLHFLSFGHAALFLRFGVLMGVQLLHHSALAARFRSGAALLQGARIRCDRPAVPPGAAWAWMTRLRDSDGKRRPGPD